LKNLLGRLMSRPFDELRLIGSLWGTFTRDPNPTHNDLAIAVYHTMVDRSAMRGMWESLDPQARSFLTWLLNQRNMLALLDDLPAQLDRPPEEVLALVEGVRRTGFVDVDEVLVRGSRVVSSGDNLYAWATKNQPQPAKRKVVSLPAEAARVLREIIEENRRPAPFDDSFSELMEQLQEDEVRRVAAVWKLPEASKYYKSELINVMSEFLATGQGRALILSHLPQAAQSLFTFLEGEGGRATTAHVKSHFKWDERELRAALWPLSQRALVWDVLSDDRRYLFIPHDLVKGAPPSAGVVPAIQPRLEAPAPAITERREPYEMPWDLLTLLAVAARQDLPLTLQDTRITRRLAKKLNDAFIHPTDIKAGTDYIDLLVHLAQTLGLLVEVQGEQPALVLTGKANEWAQLSFDAACRRLYGLWQEDRKWTEPAAYGTIYWWNSDLTGARKRLIKHLLDLPTMQWIGVEGFLRKIHLTEPFLIWSQEELVRRFGLRALQGFRSQWFDIEGRIIADMLKTMLFWLGAVELGRDRHRRLVSFRVTEQGRSLFSNQIAEQAPRPAKTLLVQPNFEVLVLHPESEVLWDLLRTADLVRHDRVSVYVISKESVQRGLECGLSVEEIVGFLDANTGKKLPQNVAQSIRDWGRQVKHVGIQRATLVEVDDPQVLDELMASRKTRRFIARRLSPTVALANLPQVGDSARDDPWQRLAKELRSAGYLPRLSAEGVAHEDPHEGETPVSSEERPSVLPITTGTGGKAQSSRRRATNSVSMPNKTGTS
jgi:hypothetical protein